MNSQNRMTFGWKVFEILVKALRVLAVAPFENTVNDCVVAMTVVKSNTSNYKYRNIVAVVA